MSYRGIRGECGNLGNIYHNLTYFSDVITIYLTGRNVKKIKIIIIIIVSHNIMTKVKLAATKEGQVKK